MVLRHMCRLSEKELTHTLNKNKHNFEYHYQVETSGMIKHYKVGARFLTRSFQFSFHLANDEDSPKCNITQYYSFLFALRWSMWHLYYKLNCNINYNLISFLLECRWGIHASVFSKNFFSRFYYSHTIKLYGWYSNAMLWACLKMWFFKSVLYIEVYLHTNKMYSFLGIPFNEFWKMHTPTCLSRLLRHRILLSSPKFPQPICCQLPRPQE